MLTASTQLLHIQSSLIIDHSTKILCELNLLTAVNDTAILILAMSTTKGALKAIGAAIQAQKYDDAVEQAQKLLANDPQQHQA